MHKILQIITFPVHTTFNIPRQRHHHFDSEKQPIKDRLLPQWMSALSDDTLVSYLSIPGTHNSATYSCGDFQASFTSQCQTWSIYDQLTAGIRFLDMRVKYSGKDLHMAHGIIKFNKFTQEVQQISKFLSLNPSQFVILAFKKENNDGGDPSDQILDQFIGKIDVIFSQQIPTVGELRGKVWILSGSDIDFNKLTFRVPGGGAGITDKSNIYMQNCWFVKNHEHSDEGRQGITRSQKFNRVMETIKVASNPTRMKFNYLNGVGEQIYYHPHPFQLAMDKYGPNFALNQTLKYQNFRGLGITIMDFPGQTLIHRIVQTNFT